MSRGTFEAGCLAFVLVSLSACTAARPIPTGDSEVASSPEHSRFIATGPLLRGGNCSESPPYVWDLVGTEAQLIEGGLSLRLPDGWEVVQERPELLVLWGHVGDGARAVIELFTAPRCDTYDGPAVHRRIGKRALAHRFDPGDIDQALDKGWSAGLGGPLGRSIILFAKPVLDGEVVPLTTYNTEVGSSDSVVVWFSAACPGNFEATGLCESDYQAIVDSLQALGEHNSP